MRIVPAASIAALFLVFTLPVLATTQTGPLVVKVTTSPNPYAIEGTTSINKSSAIRAETTGTGDSAFQGYAEGQGSVGVEGFALSTSGSPSTGVYGSATTGYGVYGETQTANYPAVFGFNTSTDDGSYGVTGEAFDTGVEGITTSDDGTGVAGIDASKDGTAYGVYGESILGTGVESFSPYGTGVYASTDTGAAGVVGETSGAIGSSSSGIDGISDGSYGVGVRAESYGTNVGDVIEGIGGSNKSDSQLVMSLDSTGNMILAGGLTQHGTPASTVRDTAGAERVAYSQRATQATIEDFGRAQMVRGRAEVRLDPTFASTLADADYLVFLTARGRSNMLYVANSSLAGFEIDENGGASTLAIDYRIVGRPRAERPEPRLAILPPMRNAKQLAADRAREARMHEQITRLAARMRAHPKPPVLPNITH